MKEKIRIIGVPMDLGQKNRGVNMGPSALRYADLAKRLRDLGYEVQDYGNVAVPVGDALYEEGNDNFLSIIAKTCELTYEAGSNAIEEGCLPVFLGGDHSISIGTIGGVTDHSPTGVIWVDAHGDFNTPETSRSGNIHGMPLSALIGKGFDELVNVGRPGAKITPDDVVLIAIRDLDPQERKALKRSGISIYTMRDIDERGIGNVVREGLKKLEHLHRIHVSLDIDSMDPVEAPGVGTPVNGGLTYREAHLMMEIISDTHSLTSMDIVEINPILDRYNKTAKIAVDLAVSLFGKSIL